MSADYFNEQGNDTFYNQGVTFRLEHHFAVFHIGLQPYAALATIYQVCSVLYSGASGSCSLPKSMSS